MAWRDNPLGIVLDGTKTADLKKLKEEGLSFVVVEGSVGPTLRNPKLSQVVQDAYDNDLPILIMFTPYPDQEQYTVDGNIAAHVPPAKALTTNHKHYGYIINVDRNWTGTDYEEYSAGTRTYGNIRWSTNANISTVASSLVHAMRDFYQRQGKTTPVLVRTSDGFVQSSSPNIAAWVGNHPFYLADWRYRMPNTADNGAYTKYVSYGATPTPIETLTALKAQLPPVEAKNPLVPGAATPLKFWEFSGRRFVHPSVKDLSGKPTTASFVLFNGSYEALCQFLAFTPKPVDPPPGGGDPNDPPPGGEDPADPTPTDVAKFISRLEAAITAAAQAWLNFKSE